MSISISHPTDRPNFSVLEVNGLTVWFSYETPIAFQRPGHSPVLRVNDWSATTGKHLNAVNTDKSLRIPGDEFTRELAEALAAAV